MLEKVVSRAQIADGMKVGPRTRAQTTPPRVRPGP